MYSTIYFATDHAGFELKNTLRAYVQDELGYEVVDCGALVYDEEDDFTDFIAKAAREVSANPRSARAIILGGSGQGEAMLANRFHDVRAVVYYGGAPDIVRLSREHNDANVLSLGARFLTVEEAKEAVAVWLSTEHTPIEKYDRRIEEIDDFSSQTGSGLPLSVVPSYPAPSFTELSGLLLKLQGVSAGFQVDIVDGVFVPHMSWPFTETDPEAALLQLQTFSESYELEIDCMCMQPETYLETFVQAGARRVVIHIGTTENYAECIAHARMHNYKIGFAFTNDVPFVMLEPYLTEIDFVQVMGIAQVGAQGQPFDERTLETVARIRAAYPQLEIAIDGAVNTDTITRLFAVGANRFAPGSALTHTDDPVTAYKHLCNLIGA